MARTFSGKFKGFSLAPSTTGAGGTQAGYFRRMGTVGRDWSVAIGDINAITYRLKVRTKDAAVRLADIMEKNIIACLESDEGGMEFSMGRLKATIGTWKPGYIENGYVLDKAMDWAGDNGVAGGDEADLSDMDPDAREANEVRYGAYRAIRHYWYDTYSVEVGTFTPYAALVEEGGSMQIAMYGNPQHPITATWEPVHMFKRGMAASYEEAEQVMREELAGAL